VLEIGLVDRGRMVAEEAGDGGHGSISLGPMVQRITPHSP
jgi:hypothetical protein